MLSSAAGHWSEQWEEIRDGLFEAWPEYSGNRYYPVPGIECADPEETEPEYYDFEDAEVTFDDCSNMWEGEYGASRTRLLNFMIDEITKEVVANEN